MEISQSAIQRYTARVGIDGLLPVRPPRESTTGPVDSVSQTCTADPRNVQMELLRRQAQQQPKLNLAQRFLIGTGERVGRGFRNLGDGLGAEVRKSLENPLRLNPVLRPTFQTADRMGVELPAPPTLPGTKMIAGGAESVVRGVGEFGASVAEDGTTALAHPVQTLDGTARLAKAVQTDTPMGAVNVLMESVATGRSYLEVRREHRQPINDAVDGIGQEFQENRRNIGLPGAFTKLGADLVGLPKTAVFTVPRAARLASTAGTATLSQTNRLSLNRQFKDLSPQQQTVLKGVVEEGAPRVAGVRVPFFAGKAEQSVSTLVKEGRLQSDPVLMSEVGALKDVNTGQGISKTGVVRDTLESVAKPGVIKQDCKGTCAATTPQFDMAETQPSNFVRTARELMGEKGEVALANGDTLVRNETGVARDGSRRRQLDRVMQSSFMDYGGQANLPKGRYDNGLDSHLNPDGSVAGGGLDTLGSERVRRGVLGEDVVSKSFPGGAARAAAEREFVRDLERAQAEGKNMQATLKWGKGDGSHAVSVTRIEDGYIYGRNPWGSGDSAQGGLKRQMVDGEGRFRAKLEDFYGELLAYHPLREPGVPYKRNPEFEIFR